jgi:peptidoglycan/LPS O-acetylase OafA/YrhL
MKNKEIDPSKGHYYWLDLLRGLAALVVLLMHSRNILFVRYPLLDPDDKGILSLIFYFFTRLGNEAVIVFFVLSGLLVGGGVIFKLSTNTFNLKSYVIDRLVRIVLPLFSALLLIILCAAITGRFFHPVDYLGNLLSLQGILVPVVSGPLWSLSYEVWFYILAGGVAVWFSIPKYKFVGLLVCFVCSWVFVYGLKPIYLFIWVLGAFSFYKTKKNNYLWGSVVLMGISILIYQFIGRNDTVLHYVNYQIGVTSELSLGFSVCIFVQQLMLRAPKTILGKYINNMGTRLAHFSYTLYLTHSPILALLVYWGFPQSKSVDIMSITYWICANCICLICAYLIYSICEKHTLAVKLYLKQKWMPDTSQIRL